MNSKTFADAVGFPSNSLEHYALLGLQRHAQKSLASAGRVPFNAAADHMRSGSIPDKMPTNLSEGQIMSAVLWGILGSDAPDDRYVGQSGPVGIANMMTWGMQEGRVDYIKQFLAWTLFNTRHDERERIFCEAMRHPQTIEILKPIIPGIFYEAVYPSPGFRNEEPSKTSSGFIPLVKSAARYPELHEMIDEVLPAALERELAWCPQNAASLALGRYQGFGDMSPVFPVVREMLAKCEDDPQQLANPNCISLIDKVQGLGNKEMLDLLRGYRGYIFPREPHMSFLDGTECMLVRVNASGTVDAVSRNTEFATAHVHVANGTVHHSRASSANFEDYPELYETLRDMAKMHFRHIAVAADKAAKAVSRFINSDSQAYRGMPQAYQSQHPQPGGRG